jgi:asparagine synthase (glutamine-hydrolysing)
MCGIAGRIGPHAGRLDSIKKMTDSLFHRGPDDEGFFVLPNVELGARRLAIIDIEGGHQPIVTVDGKVAVALNGEIYNFAKLRVELLSRGCPLKTQGDTEVLAYLYQLDGIDFVQKLRGMFAISIWDSTSQSLILIRDRLGEKPLLYSQKANGGIDFASEAKALLRMGAAKEADLCALDFVLTFGYAPPPMTGFTSIAALPPAHFLIWNSGRTEIKRYWKFESTEKADFSSLEAQDAVHDALEESVRNQMISERPLGVFLSGGVDSSLVAALASKHSPHRLKTYSIGFKDQRFDESKYARQVAAHLGTDHHELIVDPNPVLMMEILTNTLDRPFADSSLIPTYLLSEFARSGVVVALGGDGGDEALGGYSRYMALEQRDSLRIPLAALSPFHAGMERIGSNSTNRYLSRFTDAIRPYRNKQERYRGLVSLVHTQERKRLWRDSPVLSNENLDPNRWFRGIWESAKGSGSLDTALAVDIETYLPEDLNFKTDIASMANSLELRSPYQDHIFMELCGTINGDLKFQNGETKYILKQVAKRYVPANVVDRTKMGFGFPRASWLRNELKGQVSEVLLGATSRNRGWFNQKELNRVIHLHNNGLDRDRILWPLFVIEVWAQKWLD